MVNERPLPPRLGSLIQQLITRRGYAQVLSTSEFQATVEAVVGKELAKSIQIGKLNRGVLHIYAANSVTMQELTFYKRKLLTQLQADFPMNRITDVRFRVQT